MKMEPVIEQRRASLFLIAGADRPSAPCVSAQLWIIQNEGQKPYLLNQESTNFVVPFAPRPDDKEVTAKDLRGGLDSRETNSRDRSIRDPSLGTFQDISSVGLFSDCLHPGRIRAVVWFSEALQEIERMVKCR